MNEPCDAAPSFSAHLDLPILPVFSVLADGAERSITALARAAAVTAAEVESVLRMLAEAGVALRRVGDTVQLPTAFVPLDAGRIKAALAAQRAWDVRVVGAVASTNSELLRQARGGARFATPALLATEIQSAGRGRQGRSWQSTAGASLTVSYALTIARGLAGLSGLSLTCGLAVRDVLAAHGVAAQLKWPNDVLIDDCKLAGILVEAHPLHAAASIVVVGIGINIAPDAARALRMAPDGLPAIAMQSAGAPHPDRNALAAGFADALGERLARFSDAGFAAFSREWNAAHAFSDRRVRLVESDGAVIEGVARGVDATGRLLLDSADGMRAVVAGDVSLRRLSYAAA